MGRQTVLITGASGGIGYEMAKLLAEKNYDIVAVARSEDKLLQLQKELESQYGILVTVIPKDVSAPQAVTEIEQELEEKGISVELLINNAGFGHMAAFLDADWSRQKTMLDLNVSALMEMCYVFGKKMQNRGGGRILNISSIAGFSAGPNMAVYYASKAFVLSFSQALAEELQGTGVTVTALCPGPVSTDFEKRAKMGKSVMFDRLRPTTAKQAAAAGLHAMFCGKEVKYHGPVAGAYNVVCRLLPRKWTARIAKSMNRAKK